MNILEIVAIVLLSLWWYLEIKTDDDDVDTIALLIPLTLAFIVFEVVNHWKYLTQPLW